MTTYTGYRLKGCSVLKGTLLGLYMADSECACPVERPAQSGILMLLNLPLAIKGHKILHCML